jgi:hypothetical protein
MEAVSSADAIFGSASGPERKQATKSVASDNPAAQPRPTTYDPLLSDPPPECAAADDPLLNGATPEARAGEAQPTDSVSEESQCQAKFDALVNDIRICCAPRFTATAWSFLDLDNRLRIDMPPDEFLGWLEDEYGTQTLINLGFVAKNGDEVRPATIFAGDPPLYITFNKEERSIGVSHEGGDLFCNNESALDCALKQLAPDTTRIAQSLFVVGSEDDVDVLRAIDLPAVIADGLEGLRHGDVERLFAEDLPSDSEWRYHLVLLDFDVAGLDNTPAAAIGVVAERLADVAEVYGQDPGRRFAIFRPSADQFKELKLTTSFENIGILPG